jgi:hypothetical protein
MRFRKYSPPVTWTSRENCSIPYRKRMIPGIKAKTSSHEITVWLPKTPFRRGIPGPLS